MLTFLLFTLLSCTNYLNDSSMDYSVINKSVEEKTISTSYTLKYDTTNYLDLDIPSSSTSTPLVILVHGGGWTSGTRTNRATLLPKDTLLTNGIAVASIDYSLANGTTVLWDDQVTDVIEAINFCKTNASLYNLDSNRIALLGTSAGGHLAAMASEEVDGLILWYSPTDLTQSFSGLSTRTQLMIFGTRRPSISQKEDASPIYTVVPDKSILFHGTLDDVVPYTQSENAALIWGSTLRPVYNAKHGFAGATNTEITDIINETTNWVLNEI